MQPVREESSLLREKRSREWAKLGRKLRWIGLEDEARRLELALSTLPAEERAVSAEPSATD